MVKIVVENFIEDALRKLYCDLDNKNDDSDDCEVCSMPTLLHSDNSGKRILGPCDRYSISEINKAWSLFRKKIRPIRIWYRDNMEKSQKNSKFLQGFKTMTEAIMNGNKDIEDLEKYIAEHVDVELDTIEMQKFMGIVKVIYLDYGRTRSEEVEESEKGQETRNRCLEGGKEFESMEELRVHEKNCDICEQCNNGYDSKEELEDHIRRRHTKYNCDQCDNWYG